MGAFCLVEGLLPTGLPDLVFFIRAEMAAAKGQSPPQEIEEGLRTSVPSSLCEGGYYNPS